MLFMESNFQYPYQPLSEVVEPAACHEVEERDCSAAAVNSSQFQRIFKAAAQFSSHDDWGVNVDSMTTYYIKYAHIFSPKISPFGASSRRY